MHAPARVDVVQWMGGFYAISMKYLCYFYELFTLLAQTNRTAIYGMCDTPGVGCWTRGLTKAHGDV
jgi:hypothetical protein